MGLTDAAQALASFGHGELPASFTLNIAAQDPNTGAGGTGQNLPITAQQVQQGLRANTIKELASKAGLSTDEVTSQLMQLLPKVVDKLTPNGQIPQADVVSKGLDMLKGLMK